MVFPNIERFFKQSNEWSCGVMALRYLLYLEGWILTPTEDELNTNMRDGTDYPDIEKYLTESGIKWESSYWIDSIMTKCDFPRLVSYEYWGEGHYGVVTDIEKGKVIIFNPYTGKKDKYTIKEFDRRWFSKKYADKWGLKRWSLKIKGATK